MFKLVPDTAWASKILCVTREQADAAQTAQHMLASSARTNAGLFMWSMLQLIRAVTKKFVNELLLQQLTCCQRHLNTAGSVPNRTMDENNI